MIELSQPTLRLQQASAPTEPEEQANKILHDPSFTLTARIFIWKRRERVPIPSHSERRRRRQTQQRTPIITGAADA